MRNGYFDCNATTPLCEVARDAWLEASEVAWFNPNALYQGAVRTRALLEDARCKMAKILDCSAESIIFTSGATESNNALFRYLREAGSGTVLLPETEHVSVRNVVTALFPGRYEWLPLDANGVVCLDSLEQLIAGGGVQAVSVMAVNNESGLIQPWKDIQALCTRNKVWFHSDATQWVGKMPASGIGCCDFVSLSAHKFGGPKGVGLLKVPAGIEFSWLTGGPQESGRRSGTEDYPSIAAMLRALQVAETNASTNFLKRSEWREDFEAAIKRAIPGVRILCEKAPRVWNTTMLFMPKYDGWRWVQKLDARGFSVGLGAACSAASDQGDVVATRLGVSRELANRSIRVSAGWESSRDVWVGLAEAFLAVWKLLEAEDSKDSVVDMGAL